MVPCWPEPEPTQRPAGRPVLPGAGPGGLREPALREAGGPDPGQAGCVLPEGLPGPLEGGPLQRAVAAAQAAPAGPAGAAAEPQGVCPHGGDRGGEGSEGIPGPPPEEHGLPRDLLSPLGGRTCPLLLLSLVSMPLFKVCGSNVNNGGP